MSGIILSAEDAELLKMNDLQLAAKCLRSGGAEQLAKVCEDAHAEIARLRAQVAELQEWKDEMISAAEDNRLQD